MALYEYKAYDQHGRKQRGVVEALSQKAANQKLRGQGLFPTRLVASSRSSNGARKGFLRRVNVIQLGLATRQLATILSAGMPLDEALATVAGQQEQGELGTVLTQVRNDVLQGAALHSSLQAHSGIFPELFTNMVKVGEESGTLDRVLLQLADYMDEQARFSARMKAALTYPLLMLIVGCAVMFFLMTFVVPKVTRMLDDLEQSLPLPTEILMAISGFLSSYWWLLLALIFVLMLGFRRVLATRGGRYWFDEKKYRLPLFGVLGLNSATARFAGTTATLLRSGVPLLTTLEIVEGLLGNTYLQQALSTVREKVTEGAGLAEPLAEAGVFPSMLAQMAAVGERSGELEGMLSKVAEIYEHQVQSRLNGLMSLLEPVMILVMGASVGFIVLAVLLPIFQASQGIG